ncbi:uncharacterized protein LOC114332593 [Diabrotica virgifera virgifera]|uniref:Uncharacterized protein LOC114332593 n=1 Tax=Diabrotica virgifera virgifera TaxID=50390 RepID=A0A6P7FTS9_DIAVI|nr:uncharacterized protein LOC114332593 [Diabrotica virgifera virgifera]
MNFPVIFTLSICFFAVANCKLDKKDFGAHLLEVVDVTHDKCQRITGASQALIDEMKKGSFPEDIAMKRYTYCLWMLIMKLREDLVLDSRKLWYYVPDMHKEDAVVYMKCNEEARKLPGDDLVSKIWNMQKCIQKNIDDKHYIYF